MTDCVFCRIAAGDLPATVVYRDEQILAFRDRSPKAPVHLLVIPRKHIANLNRLTEADASLMAHIMLRIPEIASGAGLHDGYRTVTNTGKGGRQEVYHMHFHILGGGRLPAM